MTSKIVFKYQMPYLGDQFDVKMPPSWKPLHLGMQGDLIVLWVETSVGFEPTSTVRFATYGTGQAIPDSAEYMGTLIGAALTYHVYKLWCEF